MFLVLLQLQGAGAVFASDTCSHKWSSYEVIKSPNCKETGIEMRHCTLCGMEEERKIPVNDDHKWTSWEVEKPAVCGKSGYRERSCAVCDKVERKTIPAAGKHAWSSWRHLEKATIYHSGRKKRVCAQCGKVQVRNVRKLKPKVRFRKTFFSVRTGKRINLRSQISFSAGDKVRKWKSSDSSVASVNAKGKLRARGAGTARITVIMRSGKKARCTVRVK